MLNCLKLVNITIFTLSKQSSITCWIWRVDLDFGFIQLLPYWVYASYLHFERLLTRFTPSTHLTCFLFWQNLWFDPFDQRETKTQIEQFIKSLRFWASSTMIIKFLQVSYKSALYWAWEKATENNIRLPTERIPEHVLH